MRTSWEEVRMSEKRFKKGDRVAWETPQGKTTGPIVEKLTRD
jgi:hypothetical protein